MKLLRSFVICSLDRKNKNFLWKIIKMDIIRDINIINEM